MTFALVWREIRVPVWPSIVTCNAGGPLPQPSHYEVRRVQVIGYRPDRIGD